MEGDSLSECASARSRQFQSTPSHGGRRSNAALITSSSVFQSTPSHGGRLGVRSLKFLRALFQSTPSHGGRRSGHSLLFSSTCFNPRPHMEGDPAPPLLGRLCPVSIHALTWRATADQHEQQGRHNVSIHALTWRATCGADISGHCRSSFNPRPHMEGDGSEWQDGLKPSVSIHALTWRATKLHCAER